MSPFSEFVQIAYQVQPDEKILRGSGAERKIHEQLRLGLNRDYYIMHNVLLPNDGKHGFSQIDHIIVSKFGIFCIEEKAHSGEIVGDSKRECFYVRYRKRTFPMLNPVLQNRGHIAAIEYILGSMIKEPIESIVVLPNALSLKVDGYERDICPEAFLVDRIRCFDRVVYSDDEITRIKTALIRSNAASSVEAISYHRQSIRAAYHLTA